MEATIQAWGNSKGIRIPKSILDEINWKEGDSVELKTRGKRLIIEKADAIPDIEALFSDFEGEYIRQNVDWGQPVGREIW